MEASSASSWWEGRPTASSSSTATTTLVVALILGFSLFNIDSSPIDLSNRVVLYQILCDRLIGEGDEAEAARGTCVDILEDDGIVNFSKFHEVLFELLRGQLEVEATYKDLALRVSELYGVLRVIAAAHSVLLHDLNVWVRLLDVLPIVCHHEVVVLMMATSTVSSMVVMVATTSHISTFTTALVVVSRFNIDAFVQDIVALSLVLPNDASLYLLGLVFVIETE